MSAKTTTKRVNSENFTCVLMGSIIFALEFGCECAMPVTVHVVAHAQKASARARSYPSSTFVSSAVGTCLDAAFTAVHIIVQLFKSAVYPHPCLITRRPPDRKLTL